MIWIAVKETYVVISILTPDETLNVCRWCRLVCPTVFGSVGILFPTAVCPDTADSAAGIQWSGNFPARC